MKKFFAKILLFGEYSVLSGSSAMTIPYRRFGGTLQFSETGNEDKITTSHTSLKKFADYLESIERMHELGFDFSRLKGELEQGLYFESDIPLHYGLGSSGALVAAVLDRYLINAGEMEDPALREVLARTESYFHGQSSGMDPMSSFTGMPLAFSRGMIGRIPEDQLMPLLQNFHLYDTGESAATERGVQLYLKNQKQKPALFGSYIETINEVVKEVQEDAGKTLHARMPAISEFQYQYFRALIPESLHEIWREGLRSGHYFFKLCGSGGGGFFLVYSSLQESELAELFPAKLLPVQT